MNGRRGNKRPATDLGERRGNTVRGNIPKVRNKTLMVVICGVPNGNNDQTSSNQFPVSYPDVSHCEELIDFMET
jgi:hypothetical protein